MIPRHGSLTLALLLAVGCNAPDYTPVGAWASTASLAIDYPPVAARPDPAPQFAAPAEVSDGVIAMQEALAVYLTAISVLANDGLLTHRDDPFTEVAPRAAKASHAGGQAVAWLGTLLRHATRTNARAPEMRDFIVTADPAVQALIASLVLSAAAPADMETGMRQADAEEAARLAASARDPAARRAVLEWAALREAEAASRSEARRRYVALLRQVATGHALLKDKSSQITQPAVVQEINLGRDQLRRATLLLPRTALVP